jgi:hypothetical protein
MAWDLIKGFVYVAAGKPHQDRLCIIQKIHRNFKPVPSDLLVDNTDQIHYISFPKSD